MNGKIELRDRLGFIKVHLCTHMKSLIKTITRENFPSVSQNHVGTFQNLCSLNVDLRFYKVHEEKETNSL
jgi:hypothetical protein